MSSFGSPESLLQAPIPERVIAAVIDIAVAVGISFFPKIGWIFGLFYFLIKDSIPFFKGQSLGKKLMRIKTITLPEQESLVSYPEKSIIRGVVALIPVLNLIDLLFLYSTGYRLADGWAQTAVVPYSESDSE